MDFRMGELRCKEVINVVDGTRYGYVGDIIMDLESGQIQALIVPGRLRLLGERAAALPQLFPNGVNVSFAEHTGPNRIYVSTCERGAGITSSCGTAMTSSATAMALLGCVSFGERVEVRNAGGAVWCTCVREGDELCTELVGNATFAGEGRVVADAQGVVQSVERLRRFDDEIAAYDDFCRRLAAAE